MNQEIIVYCASGKRSHEAAKLLAEMGYTMVYDLGGINTWPYEVKNCPIDLLQLKEKNKSKN